jgi:site-specific recombinase XerD
MTALRQRMIEDLRLRGYADRTVEAYVSAVARLARFHHASPDRLTEEQLRAYLLHLTTQRRITSSSFTVVLSGLRFFYEQTLKRRWTILDAVRPKREKKLPVVLSRDEVWRVIAAVRTPAYRVCLTTIYACGLRLMEGLHLHVADVDSGRSLLHIHHGKGGIDRRVPCRRRPSWVCAHSGERIGIRSGSSRRRTGDRPDRCTIRPLVPSGPPVSKKPSSSP